MGAVSLLPRELIANTARTLAVPSFIETGTWEGTSTEIAAGMFQKVLTCEIVQERFESSRARLAKYPHVTCLQGDSPSSLRQMLPQVQGTRTLFWLDAHPHPYVTSGSCPLADELAVINESGVEAYILADDARFFLTPLVPTWPDIETIVRLMSNGQKRFVSIVDDIFIAYPMAHRTFVTDYASSRPRAWETPTPPPPAPPRGPVFLNRFVKS